MLARQRLVDLLCCRQEKMVCRRALEAVLNALPVPLSFGGDSMGRSANNLHELRMPG